MFILRYLLLWAITSIIVLPVQAQSLVDRYKSARFNVQVDEFFETNGMFARPQ